MFDCDCNLIFVFHSHRTKPTRIIFVNFCPLFSAFNAVKFQIIGYLLIKSITTSLNFNQTRTNSPFKFHFLAHNNQSVFYPCDYIIVRKLPRKLFPNRPEINFFFSTSTLNNFESSFSSFSFTKNLLFFVPVSRSMFQRKAKIHFVSGALRT